MSLGRRGAQHNQASMWIESGTLARLSGHPFYERLNVVLDKHRFDFFAEQACAPFYSTTGRPGLAPGVYFRCLLVGYFEDWIPSVGLHGELRTRWHYVRFWAMNSVRAHRITRPSH